jgi:hypothetical protein
LGKRGEGRDGEVGEEGRGREWDRVGKKEKRVRIGWERIR